MALSVDNIDAVEGVLKAHCIEYHVNVVPGTDVRQIFFYDPDGNGIEIIDFDGVGDTSAEPYEGRKRRLPKSHLPSSDG